MSKDPLRANLHYKGYTAKDILARAPSRGLIYSGNRTFAFVDKLLIRTTDTFPSKCSFCQCNFIYTEGFFFWQNDVYACSNFLCPAICQHT